MFTGAVTVAKALLAVIALLNLIVSLIYQKVDAESQAKLKDAIDKARSADTIAKAADAATDINNSF